MLLLFCTAWVSAQTVKGVITDEEGLELVGATVLVEGTNTGTVSDLDGSYTINAGPEDVLIYSFTGYIGQRITVGSQTIIDVTMQPDVAVLEQIVVTGYNQQRKGDITGAVAVLDTDALTSVAASSVNQQLEGRATGVTISTSGAAGDGTNIRIRGVSSFTNNNPLIVVDGVPQFNSFLNNINPNDIASVQILKDASSASIYGTRALNGVIIITTKKGQSGKAKISYDAYYGLQGHERGWDDILFTDSEEYAQMFFKAFENDPSQNPLLDFYGGGTSPVIPDYSFVCAGCRNADGSVNEAAFGYPNNLIFGTNKEGTNWWEETTRTAPIQDHTLSISGGTDNGTYRISANYFNQQGTLIESYFKRMSIRANSQWTAGKLTIGQSLNVSRVANNGTAGGRQDELGVLMQIVKMQPIIPVYAIDGETFAGGKGTGLSNGSNPVALQTRNRNNLGEFDNVIGSFYGEFAVTQNIKVKSTVGVNYGVGGSSNFTFPTFENAEPSTNTLLNDSYNRDYGWVWTNTANYNKSFNERHNLNVLVGYEAQRQRGRNLNGNISGFLNFDPNIRYINGAVADYTTRNIGSGGYEETLLSTFGKLDYSLDNKYLISATVRRDGSSKFGNEKYNIFPSASLGWRISAEPFMADIAAVTDLKLRVGYGIVGNERIRNYNFVSNFGGGPAQTGYAITGSNNAVVTGLTGTSLGNPNTSWEEKTTLNTGIDLTLLDGKLGLVLDVYTTDVDGLLFNPALPQLAGLIPPAFVNIAGMQNNGFDFSVNWRPNVGKVKFDITGNLSRYVNKITSIDGNTTEFFSNQGPGIRVAASPIQINRVGNSIGSFFGYQTGGIWQSDAEISAANAGAPMNDDGTAGTFQAGAIPGAIRYVDVAGRDENGNVTGPDGQINDDDLTIIGNPHPDFTASLNIGAKIGNLDFTAFFTGSFGNDIFNATKQFTIFRQFNTNADRRLLTDTWTPDNPDAELPALYANTVSNAPSSFYVEDGSYVRLNQLQVGYTLPASFGGDTFSRLRFYIQGQNLITFTNYSGLDPNLSSFGASGGNVADDLFMGVDIGNYPTVRSVIFGVSASF
ncbi:TonB-dependent receptor [Neolewinella lacunae]|uniref:TonB-dependent receptor n=2 Tax=Neolewinella lacunae TaxID=1517758 RepID=A0A923T9G5_9BACT|nr:TonB-dependent receptor [Neolewinella lacunae]MBC6995038.1 TonB-dependent receptor [Neolewinella lacunae]MDN3634035.1 TonB-dependent receptor [Neolewinella lacunae]